MTRKRADDGPLFRMTVLAVLAIATAYTNNFYPLVGVLVLVGVWTSAKRFHADIIEAHDEGWRRRQRSRS